MILVSYKRGKVSHQCDKQVKETIDFLKQYTKWCPTCKEMIHKSSGCDQMLCNKFNTLLVGKVGSYYICSDCQIR